MKENLLQIINHYGIKSQQRKFQEEVFELNEAIIKAEENLALEKYIEHITEEIADVCVMLEQFIEYYNIDRNDVEKIMKFKIHRQLERIENEKENR